MNTIEEANQLLAGYVPLANELLGKDITLERMRPLMKLIGNPEDMLKIIHIAGTSGKTSTAYYIASLLQASGQKVGLTVSPHLDSVTERVQINLEPLDDAEFCQALTEFLEIIETHNQQPTYFELLIAFAYWYFAKAGVDYAVIETGLGGLQDATNVADLPDKICVITDIGYDHMHVLGSRIEEIAHQKAGIIKPANQVFMYDQDVEIQDVFSDKAKNVKATLNVLREGEERENMMIPETLQFLPAYQQRNWLLAYETYQYIRTRDALPMANWESLQASLSTIIPGRMDTVHINGKTLIMDGAHNDQKMQAFMVSFQALYPDRKAAIVLALKEGKEYQAVLPLLLPICSRLIITSFDVLQDLPTKSIDPKVLAEAAEQSGFKDITIEHNPLKAYKLLNDSGEEILIITGSFYLLSCIRPAIMNRDD